MCFPEVESLAHRLAVLGGGTELLQGWTRVGMGMQIHECLHGCSRLALLPITSIPSGALQEAAVTAQVAASLPSREETCVEFLAPNSGLAQSQCLRADGRNCLLLHMEDSGILGQSGMDP